MKETNDEKKKRRKLADILTRIHTIMVDEHVPVNEAMLIISEEMKMTVLPWVKSQPEVEAAVLEMLYMACANAVEAVMEAVRDTAAAKENPGLSAKRQAERQAAAVAGEMLGGKKPS